MPPADLPEAGPLAKDRLGSLSVTAFIWKLTRLQQLSLSCIITVSIIPLWSKFLGSYKAETTQSKWFNMATITAVFGWALRVWSKQTLGKHFTYQISKPAHLVTSGPYRWLVHPGYTGVIFHFLGIVMLATKPLECSNWSSRLKLPVVVAFTAFAYMILLKRIEDEEMMLSQHFSSSWLEHTSHRWKILPFLY